MDLEQLRKQGGQHKQKIGDLNNQRLKQEEEETRKYTEDRDKKQKLLEGIERRLGLNKLSIGIGEALGLKVERKANEFGTDTISYTFNFPIKPIQTTPDHFKLWLDTTNGKPTIDLSYRKTEKVSLTEEMFNDDELIREHFMNAYGSPIKGYEYSPSDN